jgi:hypothetical protein
VIGSYEPLVRVERANVSVSINPPPAIDPAAGFLMRSSWNAGDNQRWQIDYATLNILFA